VGGLPRYAENFSLSDGWGQGAPGFLSPIERRFALEHPVEDVVLRNTA
jgi:hypothetical protein